MRFIRRGVPTQVVNHFLRIARLSFNGNDPPIVNRRTVKCRQLNAEQLDQAESDRLLRMVGVVATAEETFGDAEKAHVWLNRQNRTLIGETPRGMADTDQGALLSRPCWGGSRTGLLRDRPSVVQGGTWRAGW